MFFIPLILTAGLDLSLPEFQPELDASGNYIVAEYDDVSGAFAVEEVRELPNGLTAAALAQDYESDSGEVIYNRDGSGSLFGTRVTHWRFRTDSMKLTYTSGYAIRFIDLQVGYTYTFTTDYDRGVYMASALEDNVDLVSISSPFTPLSSCVAVVPGSYSLKATFVSSGNVPDDPSGNDPSGNDPSGNDPTPDNPSIDVSGVVSELQSIHEEFSMKFRIIIFVLIWQFIMPLAMKIRDHIFNLKHD